jgi:hypothetical protein
VVQSGVGIRAQSRKREVGVANSDWQLRLWTTKRRQPSTQYLSDILTNGVAAALCV